MVGRRVFFPRTHFQVVSVFSQEGKSIVLANLLEFACARRRCWISFSSRLETFVNSMIRCVPFYMPSIGCAVVPVSGSPAHSARHPTPWPSPVWLSPQRRPAFSPRCRMTAPFPPFPRRVGKRRAGRGVRPQFQWAGHGLAVPSASLQQAQSHP